MTEKKHPGRPPGITKYGEAGKHGTHWMTPAAHAWVKKNRDWIEKKVKRLAAKAKREAKGKNNANPD